jgi:hypothetical protein
MVEIPRHLHINSTLSVFATGDGYLGLGPKSMGVEDEICFLNGLNATVVLRRVGDHHVYLGTCIVLGLEEVVSEGSIELERFEIR